MLWLEIQEGKERMKTKEFQGRLVGTAACVMRGVKASEDLEPTYRRTTATGGLPNISFIKRKPEPLETEFKTIVDGMTG